VAQAFLFQAAATPDSRHQVQSRGHIRFQWETCSIVGLGHGGAKEPVEASDHPFKALWSFSASGLRRTPYKRRECRINAGSTVDCWGKTMRIINSIAVFGVVLLAACSAGSRPDRVQSPAPEVAVPAPARPVEAAAVAVEQAAEVSQADAPTAPTPALAVAAAPVSEPVARTAPAAKPATSPVMAAKPARAPVAVEKPVVPVSTEPAPGATPEVADSTGGGLRGQLELLAGSGQSLSADEISHAVVYYVPDSGAIAAKPGRYRIYTHNKEFEPASLVIPLGSTISFPNQDEILHNVFSVTPRSSFDLGIYGEGKSADYTFTKTGLVLINCNVHQAMQANVLVVDTPFIVSPGSDGRFAFDKLPAGSGKLMVWHPRANVQGQVVKVPAQGLVSVRLILTKPRVSEHLNKERKPY
jgi:plastocyanin